MNFLCHCRYCKFAEGDTCEHWKSLTDSQLRSIIPGVTTKQLKQRDAELVAQVSRKLLKLKDDQQPGPKTESVSSSGRSTPKFPVRARDTKEREAKTKAERRSAEKLHSAKPW